MLRGMVENLTDRTTQIPTNDESSSMTGCLVEKTPIMFAWEVVLWSGVNWAKCGRVD